MPAIEIKQGIYDVGVNDWNIRAFHGPTLSTFLGTSYNAYLILDEKITLVDTVYTPFAKELLENIQEVVDPEKIDYIIINHLEMDHLGALPEVKKVAKNAKIFASPKGKAGLPKQLPDEDWDITAVKTGDTLSIGKRTLSFIEAPMLHWPDSMFTYIKEEKLLLPNDAFGQHLASSKRFDDEVEEDTLMYQAAKYYANILSPFSPLVIKKINEIVSLNLEIDMIAPSHGIIWRKDPGKIIHAYLDWATRKPTQEKVVIVYDTLWGTTEKMAHKILEGISSSGLSAVLYKMSKCDLNEVITDIQSAKAVLVGSSTINNEYIPSLSAFLDELSALKVGGKPAAAFGSYGWAEKATKLLEEKLIKAGNKIVKEPITVQFKPTKEDLQKCYEYGREFAALVLNHEQ